jgi:hypothetical protein
MEERETLPKDISQKPHNHFSQQEDQLKMKKLIKEIDSIIGQEICENAADWNFSAIGAKPCGGASSYIAYPKNISDEIMPKIMQLTTMQSAFNSQYQIISDCSIVLPPVEIKCENGKAVLVGDHSEKGGDE